MMSDLADPHVLMLRNSLPSDAAASLLAVNYNATITATHNVVNWHSHS